MIFWLFWYHNLMLIMFAYLICLHSLFSGFLLISQVWPPLPAPRGWGVASLSDRYLLPSWSTAGMQCSTPSYSIARKVRIGRLLWLSRSLAVVAIVWRRVIMLQIMTLTTFSAALTMVVQWRTPAWLYTAVTGIDSESLEHRIRDESDNSGPPLRGRWNNFSVWQL